MLSRDLRKRIEELNRSYRSRDNAASARTETARNLTLEDAVPGEVVETSAGEFLVWERPVSELLPAGDDLISTYSFIFDRGGYACDPEQLHPDLLEILKTDPDKIFFMDIETTGLGTGSAFLVGLMTYESKMLGIRQLLARDYSEEVALLTCLAEYCSRYEGLVTFNGKSFDFRYLQERFIANGVPCFQEFKHLDLLHEGRRRFKELLPNCKLQTLEKYITGRSRFGDIPGAEIPDAYHNFVKTGNARQMKEILHHNALDLITMAEILVHILS